MQTSRLGLIGATCAIVFGCNTGLVNDVGSLNHDGGGGAQATGGINSTGGVESTGGGGPHGGAISQGGALPGSGGALPNGGALNGCANTGELSFDASTVDNAFVTSVSAVGDASGPFAPEPAYPNTTLCVDSPSVGTVCMDGLGAKACGGTDPCDFHLWGAQMSFGFATDSGPFDATAVGATGVQVTLSNIPATGIRFGINMPDDPTTGAIDESFPFEYGADLPVLTNGTLTVQFYDFVQPSWGDPALVFDPTKLAAVDFAVPTQVSATTPYDFCVTDVQLVDATGSVIVFPGSGGAGGGTSIGGGGGGLP